MDENSGSLFIVSKPNIQHKPNGITSKELPIHFLSVYNVSNIENNLESDLINPNGAKPISLNHMKSVDDISFDADTKRIFLLDSTYESITVIDEPSLSIINDEEVIEKNNCFLVCF
jgi:hypothetical protein